MRPYLLKGHERPLTQVKFNHEGDLLVSCAKNSAACLWWVEDGKRLGTFDGHNGAIWSCDITWDSDRLITAAADQTVKIWDMQTGKTLFTVQMKEPCRAVNLSAGEGLLAFTTDAFMGSQPKIHLLKHEADISMQTDKTVAEINAPPGRITRVYWSDMNRTLVTSHDQGWVRKWDSETGKLLLEKQVHEDAIQDMQLSPDGAYVITASLDKTAKLVDLDDFSTLKTYKTGRYVQSAAMSPIFDHVLLGGGQDAASVTTTSAKAGGFEARFFHKIYQEEFGHVRGHFGPINTVAFSPSGRSFVTGGEDGYVRLHHFDHDYLSNKVF
ncbi:eukaryotic initiation factor [Haematococcus lacustris]